jgi:hypothetical protein
MSAGVPYGPRWDPLARGWWGVESRVPRGVPAARIGCSDRRSNEPASMFTRRMRPRMQPRALSSYCPEARAASTRTRAPGDPSSSGSSCSFTRGASPLPCAACVSCSPSPLASGGRWVAGSCAGCSSPARASFRIAPANPPLVSPPSRVPPSLDPGALGRGSSGPGSDAASRTARVIWRSRSGSVAPASRCSCRSRSASMVSAALTRRRRSVSIASRGAACASCDVSSPRRRLRSFSAKSRTVFSVIANGGSFAPACSSSPAIARRTTRDAGRTRRSS